MLKYGLSAGLLEHVERAAQAQLTVCSQQENKEINLVTDCN